VFSYFDAMYKFDKETGKLKCHGIVLVKFQKYSSCADTVTDDFK